MLICASWVPPLSVATTQLRFYIKDWNVTISVVITMLLFAQPRLNNKRHIKTVSMLACFLEQHVAASSKEEVRHFCHFSAGKQFGPRLSKPTAGSINTPIIPPKLPLPIQSGTWYIYQKCKLPITCQSAKQKPFYSEGATFRKFFVRFHQVSLTAFSLQYSIRQYSIFQGGPDFLLTLSKYPRPK